MTDREKAIVMAYTGYAMLTEDKLDVFYAYVREKLGRPIMTHEFSYSVVIDEIREASREDFIALGKEDGEPHVMTDVDTVVQGLKCCRNWESLRGRLPECADCPFADENEGTCEDMNKQIDAAIDLIEAQRKHIEELHKWIRELAKAVKWDG